MRYVLYFIAFILMFIAFCLWTIAYILYTFRLITKIRCKEAWFEMKYILCHRRFPYDSEYPKEYDYWIKDLLLGY